MPDATPAIGWHLPSALRMLDGSESRGFSRDNAKVLADLMQVTGSPATEFLLGLPAFHNLDTEVGQAIHAVHGTDCTEVTNEVFESPVSVVFNRAANRLHTTKAVLVATLGG